jgi:glucosamine--fructose-6-phosphate aminotransferase (isomerizing)
MFTHDRKPVAYTVTRIDWNLVAAEKAGFEHFMLKEIHEQPNSLASGMAGRLSERDAKLYLDDIGIDPERLKQFRRICIVACGTAYYAGLVGKYLIEDLARVPVEVDLASEFRYRNPVVDEDTLMIAVTQSGETADTQAAVKEAKRRGATVVVVTNVVGSAITREADAVCYLQAGPEVAVASTKAFVTQVLVLEMIALHLACLRGTLSPHRQRVVGLALRELPRLAAETLKRAPQIKKLAQHFARVRNVMYIGRGLGYTVAMEGALKLKELSYVHAEGYAAGELKHGPIDLLDPQTPLVAVATRSATYEKLVSNVAEARARSAPVYAVATEGDEEIARYAQEVLYVPETLEELSPILAVLPLQLLAYEVAVARHTDVDQPRNLAKSVTVE